MFKPQNKPFAAKGGRDLRVNTIFFFTSNKTLLLKWLIYIIDNRRVLTNWFLPCVATAANDRRTLQNSKAWLVIQPIRQLHREHLHFLLFPILNQIQMWLNALLFRLMCPTKLIQFVFIFILPTIWDV